MFMGLHVAGILRLPVFDRLARGRLPGEGGNTSVWRAGLMGIVFGAGWTPCIGPVLSSILTLATVSSTVWSGMLLMTAYCLGLGLPIVAVAIGGRFPHDHQSVRIAGRADPRVWNLEVTDE